MWPMPLRKKVDKPCLKSYTISLSTNAFVRQFGWDVVLGKHEYLYSFVFLFGHFIIRNVCSCLLLLLVSTGISFSLFVTFSIFVICLQIWVMCLYVL